MENLKKSLHSREEDKPVKFVTLKCVLVNLYLCS